MKLKVRPLSDRIIIDRIEGDQVSKGGIILPAQAVEKTYMGKITAIGQGRRNDKGEIEPMSVKVGDTILYSKHAGIEVVAGYDEKLFFIREADVLAIV